MHEDYRQALALLRDAAGRPTATYAAYLEHQAVYEQKAQAYDAAYAKARRNPYELQSWPVTGRPLREARDAAAARWSALGARAEVDRALAVVAEHERTTPTEC
jgi:hypothetical protein